MTTIVVVGSETRNISTITMTSFQTNSGTFNIELLLSSITNTDTLVRSYKETCNENNQLKKNLQSISDSSVQITNMYQLEKQKCTELAREKESLEAKLKQMHSNYTELQHKQLNQESIHKQMHAELEERVETATNSRQTEYLELCRQFFVQGNLLQQHKIDHPQSRKKLKEIVMLLKQRGEKIDELKVIVPRRSMAAETKTTSCSIATMTETVLTQPVQRPSMCDKSTMHRMSTATRSTCTSAFIKKVDASTSTDSLNSYDQIQRVRDVFERTVPPPPLLSPIKNYSVPSRRHTRNQSTMTPIQNVCKNIDYSSLSRATSPSALGFPVRTKEECADVLSNSNMLFSSLSTAGINPELSRLWQILGETIFTIVGSGRIFNDNAMNYNSMLAPAFARGGGDVDRGFGDTFYKLQEELAKLSSLNEPVPDFCQLDNSHSDISCNDTQIAGEHIEVVSSVRRREPQNRSPSVEKASGARSRSSSPASGGRAHEHRKANKSKRKDTFDELFGSPKKIKLQQNVSILP